MALLLCGVLRNSSTRPSCTSLFVTRVPFASVSLIISTVYNVCCHKSHALITVDCLYDFFGFIFPYVSSYHISLFISVIYC